MNAGSAKERLIKAIIGGIFVGFICGFVGAGGGMMMLFVLTSFLGYQMHMAVGTSVFIMAFTALTGGISHFAIGGMPDITIMVLCAAFTLLLSLIHIFFSVLLLSATTRLVVKGSRFRSLHSTDA